MSGLQEMASNTEKMFGVACQFQCPSPVLVSDPVAATHLFRIAQESVSNAIKHGKAKRISIHLAQKGNRLDLTVSDNGVGFLKISPDQKGMGLRIMKSRAGMIGGTLVVESNPRSGTRVNCSVVLMRSG